MKLIKLLIGAICLVALCGSGTMLIVLLLGFFDGHIITRSVVSLAIVVSIFLVSSILLYYFSNEKASDQFSETERKFKSRKLIFQLLIIALITLFIIAMPFLVSATTHARLLAAIILSLFFWIYILLARRLWRCPKCEKQLPFMSQHKDRHSIKCCPSCSARLQ